MLHRLALIVILLSLGGCAATLVPRTPSLLRGVTAGRGGWESGGCPAASKAEQAMFGGMQESSSPELFTRLQTMFPPQTSAAILIDYLKDHGFRGLDTCPGDQSIHHMLFKQSGGSVMGPFPIFAVVAWKQDADGKIVWTKGQVSFTGL